MKIFPTGDIREIDAYTIENEPISSTDLMERAANSIFSWFVSNIDRGTSIYIFTGPGNNGGDGLVLARLLAVNGYKPVVYNVKFTDKYSADWLVNRERLKKVEEVIFKELDSASRFPGFEQEDILVDAIFGSGLARPAKGLPGDIIKRINDSNARVISIDIPSGLFGENNEGNDPDSIVRASVTLSLHFPKLAFMFSENNRYVGDFHILPIGLHERIIREKDPGMTLVDRKYVSTLIKTRHRFDHKGTYGHGLMVAGSCGKAGAAVLSSLAALRTGIGLLTAHVPGVVRDVIHASVPEAMIQCDESDVLVSGIENTDRYNAIGIGPGIGTKPNTARAMRTMLDAWHGPLVIDADGLNILSENKQLLKKLPAGTILTPHPGEFERLTKKFNNSYDRLQAQKELAKSTGCIVLLKGAFSSVAVPDGRVWFNPTGNPGMATAGSGDVLTGMLLSLLAQGYSPLDAAITGAWIHGLAGDIARESTGMEALIASDIISSIGKAFIKTVNP